MPSEPDPPSEPPEREPSSEDLLDLEVGVALEDARWLELLGLAGEDQAAAMLQPLAAAALAMGGWEGPAELGIVLADDDSVHAFNRTYRGVDKPTNVLSFALTEAEEPEGGGPAALGDVLLAYETVAREAAERGVAPKDYVCHLVAHGVLHLIGYDHQQEADADAMERLEARVLARFGIADPYADRSSDNPGAPADTAGDEPPAGARS